MKFKEIQSRLPKVSYLAPLAASSASTDRSLTCFRVLRVHALQKFKIWPILAGKATIKILHLLAGKVSRGAEKLAISWAKYIIFGGTGCHCLLSIFSSCSQIGSARI